LKKVAYVWNMYVSYLFLFRSGEFLLDTAGVAKMETAAGRTFLTEVFFTSTGSLKIRT
jgi:hypothetical protein